MEFENRYYGTRDIYKKYAAKVLLTGQRLLSLIAFIAIGFATVSEYLEGNKVFILFLAAEIVVIGVFIYTPNMLAKQLVKNGIGEGGEPVDNVYRFADKIYMREGTYQGVVEYSKVFRIHNLDNMYCLMFGKTNGIVLLKDSFTKGNEESFLEFISSRCPSAIIK